MNCKGNENFSTTAQFLKEIGEKLGQLGKSQKKLPLQSFTLQRYNKGVPKLGTGGIKIVKLVAHDTCRLVLNDDSDFYRVHFKSGSEKTIKT